MLLPYKVIFSLTAYYMLWFSNHMKHILYILVVFICLSQISCTIVFKAKDVELEAEPILSYELEHIDLFKESEEPYG